ncbi:MAG: substrate-binding domain-containing protein [Chloroflexota bacterium]|nr:substrate-binding domain-containing protein [Chloroflexota bacterium]
MNINPFRSLSFVFCLLFLLVACAPQPFTVTREHVTLRLVAADSCGPLAEGLAAAYEESYPWTTVQIEVWNSALAERTLRAGGADLALLSWLEQAADEEPLWSQPFAEDGIAIVTYPAAPLAEVGLAHLQEIFRGRVQEWSGVVFTTISREDGSGTRAAFEAVVLGNYAVTPTGVMMPSSGAVIEYVARTPGGIGYVSTQWVDDRVRVLPVEGVSPTLATISDGSYPLSRPLYLAAAAEPAGEAREFAQWILGPEGRAIVGQ